MDVDRPGPVDRLNRSGEGTRLRQAATVIVLRGGHEMLEVLMVRRNPRQRFMGGAWVFPGGAVDADEGHGDTAHRLAGVREVQEEAGLTLPDPAALVRLSRWITPAEVKIRFDTHFFLAAAPGGQEARADGSECVDLGWFTPQGALDAYAREEMTLVFPTIRTLEQLDPFGSPAELLGWATGREVVPLQPRVLMHGETARIVLPGEPSYEASTSVRSIPRSSASSASPKAAVSSAIVASRCAMAARCVSRPLRVRCSALARRSLGLRRRSTSPSRSSASTTCTTSVPLTPISSARRCWEQGPSSENRVSEEKPWTSRPNGESTASSRAWLLRCAADSR